MDTVLGEVAVDDGDVISLYVMQVARHEHRERGLARSAFLGGESNIQWFVFLFVHCLLGFMDDTYIDTFVCRVLPLDVPTIFSPSVGCDRLFSLQRYCRRNGQPSVGCNQPMAIGA